MNTERTRNQSFMERLKFGAIIAVYAGILSLMAEEPSIDLLVTFGLAVRKRTPL